MMPRRGSAKNGYVATETVKSVKKTVIKKLIVLPLEFKEITPDSNLHSK